MQSTVSIPEVAIHCPSRGELNLMRSSINGVNKPELIQMSEYVYSLLSSAKLAYMDANDNSPEEFAIFLKVLRKGLSEAKKPELVDFLSVFAGDIRNIFSLSKAMAPGVFNLWKELLSTVSLSAERVKNILGRKPKIFPKGSYNIKPVPEAFLLPVIIEYPGYSYKLKTDDDKLTYFIPNSLRKAAVPVFFGSEDTSLERVESLPEDKALTIESYEQDVFADMNFLAASHAASPLYGSAETVNKSKVKAVSKKLDKPEFAVNAGAVMPERGPLITTAYISMLLHNMSYSTKFGATDPADFASYITDNLPKELVGQAFAAFLQKYSGFNKSWTAANNAASIVKNILQTIDGDDSRWIDMKHFILRYLANDKNTYGQYAYTSLFNSNSRYRHTLRLEVEPVYYYSRPMVDWWEDITLPFITGYLRLLCAVGIIEIAVESTKDYDPLQGIRYIRLTPLGLYALGHAKEYVRKRPDNEPPEFDIDDRNMIVSLLNPKSPYKKFLSNIGETLSSTRYRITARSLVAGSDSYEVLEKNIRTFRNAICPQPSQEWEDMFKEAESRANSAINTRERMHLVTLDTTVPGLIEFVANDPFITRNCVKAQGARLLIPVEHYSTFRDILHRAGYLL